MLIFYRFIYIIATLVTPFILPGVVMAKGTGATVLSASLFIALLLINVLFMIVTFLLRMSAKPNGHSDEDIFLFSFMCMILIDYGILGMF